MSTSWLSGLRGKTQADAPQQAGRSWLIGASHIGALRRAQTEGAATPEMTIVALGASRVSKAVFHRLDDGQLCFTDEGYQAAYQTTGLAAGMAPGDRVGVLLGDANTILLDYAGYWQSHEPAAICQKDRMPVPQTTLEAICDAQTAPVRAFIADLQRLGFRPYWVPYPPIKDQHPMFAAGVRPGVVRFLDALFLTRMQEAMTAIGVPCVARPAAAITQTGLLKAAYSQTTTGSGAEDWVHANAGWGALMLQQIARTLDGMA